MMKFISPALLILFAMTFWGVWFLMDQSRRFLLKLGAGFLLLGAGLLSQLAFWTPDTGPTTIVSAVLYAGGVLMFSDGILMRSHRKFPRLHALAWFIGIVGVTAYFYYGDRSLVARIHTLNIGLGGIFITLLWQARFLRNGEKADRMLWIILLLFVLHFCLRTFLTAGSVGVDGAGGLHAWKTSAFWLWVQISSSIIGASMGISLLAVIAMDTMTGLKQERDSDPLTGLLNRRGLERRIANFTSKTRNTPMCIVVCDIDYFKKINDTYGHATGDTVLVHVASAIASAMGKNECAARVGGEEFVMVLYDRSAQEAYQFTEQLRNTIQSMRLADVSLVRSVTCSFGVAQFRPEEDFWRAVSRADALLYSAKKSGRNQTLAETSEVSGVA